MICIITTPNTPTRSSHMHTITRFNTHAQGLIGWLAIEQGLTVGHIFMQEEPDRRIKFLDAWTHPEHRRKKVFTSLWDTRWRYVTEHYNDYTVYAWCKPDTLKHLLTEGFHAGDTCTYVERKITSEHVRIGPTVPITC